MLTWLKQQKRNKKLEQVIWMSQTYCSSGHFFLLSHPQRTFTTTNKDINFLTKIVIFINQLLGRLVVQIGAIDAQRVQISDVMATNLKPTLPTPHH